MDTLREILGKRVRAMREARKWSQEELGKTARLGGKYIGMIERGQKTPSFDAIEKLADALNVDCYELFVPSNRRTDVVDRRIKSLLSETGRIDAANVQDFLKALATALHKLERGGGGGSEDLRWPSRTPK